MEEAFGRVGEGPPRLSAIRIETEDATTGRGGRGRARYAFVAGGEDGDYDADAYGKYAVVREETPVIRFESRALTRDAQWEATESRADGFVRLRSCARRDVVLEGTIGGRYTTNAAFGAWMRYEKALEREEEYQKTAARGAATCSKSFAEGFKKELRAIEAEIIDAGRTQYGKRVVIGDDVELSPRVENPFSPTANPFDRASPAATIAGIARCRARSASESAETIERGASVHARGCHRKLARETRVQRVPVADGRGDRRRSRRVVAIRVDDEEICVDAREKSVRRHADRRNDAGHQ